MVWVFKDSISHAYSHLVWYCLKMSIKKVVAQLEKHMSLKYPEYNSKFYANGRNFYIHLDLDKSLFSFENYKQFWQEVNSFLTEHLHTQFISVFPPKLVIST